MPLTSPEQVALAPELERIHPGQGVGQGIPAHLTCSEASFGDHG